MELRNKIMKRDVIILVLILLLAGCQKDSPSPQKADYSYSFSKVWNDYDRNYSYFVHKNINWLDMKNTYQPMVAEEITYDFFIDEVLAPMLTDLRDIHVRLTNKYGNTITLYKPEKDVNYKYDDDFYTNYITNNISTLSGSTFIGKVINNLCYIIISSWGNMDVSMSEFLHYFDTNQEIFNAFKGLIIDVRPNGGGQESLARNVAGRFTLTENLYEFRKNRNGTDHNDFTPLQPVYFSSSGNWQYTKPIAVLTGGQCASSNESFILMMSTLSHVIIIGDTTRGSSANPKDYNLEDGTTYSISSWVAYKPDTTILEDIGIFPDIAIDASESIIDGRDMVLEKAIEILQQ